MGAENRENIIIQDIDNEMRQSFLAYSMSVIMSRALPDVRDGLKPVHRRILYTMYENNLLPNEAYRKCADTVGAVLGRYHPHGDSSVYEALVRLAQDFSLRYPLVDGHGNFGSIDGDPPAAYRYTEAKMSKISMMMLTNIDKETVAFVNNYDDRLQEPTVLPVSFPNLLVNGCTGIAVGMATEIPSHNLKETIDAVNHLLYNENASVSELMQFIKAPDFPTGGIICGLSGVKQAYETGRGQFILRSKTEIVQENNKTQIVVTEIPYKVNKAKLHEQIAKLVKDKKIDGITSVEDYSDRDGIRLTIDLRRDVEPNLVLSRLFALSEMQKTYSVNNVALVNNEPKTLSLIDILKHYIDYKLELLVNATNFDLRKAKEREHILLGLTIASQNIDEVIKIIRNADSVADAKLKLEERFALSEIQSQAIVTMQLGRLTGLEQTKLAEELAQIKDKIADCEDILANKDRQKKIIHDEGIEIAKKFSDDRRTKIEFFSGQVEDEDLIDKEECIVTLTECGYLKRQKLDSYRRQNRGTKGVKGQKVKTEDSTKQIAVINSHDYCLLFTDKGRLFKIKCYEIALSNRNSMGTPAVNLIRIANDEHITNIIGIKADSLENDTHLIMITKKGLIKRSSLENYFKTTSKNGIIAINLDDNDLLSHVVCSDDDSNKILVATSLGQALKFNETDLRVLGRNARGVKAINLAEDDTIVSAVLVKENDNIVTITEKAFGRISLEDEYRHTKRGGKGVINARVDKTGKVVSVFTIKDDEDIMLINSEGNCVKIDGMFTSTHSRTSLGVKVMKLAENEIIISATHSPKVDEDAEEEIEDLDEMEE